MQYGLIGEKLSHSFSKDIHESLSSYTYELMEIQKASLSEFMRTKDFKGINVTIPYKETVIPFIDVLDPLAKQAHAVNTIVCKNQLLYGYNSDVDGFLYLLRKHCIPIDKLKIGILGNGGASKAVQIALQQLHVFSYVVITRKQESSCIDYVKLYEHHTDITCFINTTPVGMYPKVDEAAIDLTKFLKCSWVIDIVYNPIQTKLTYCAKRLGISYVNGLDMLVGQAKRAVELFVDEKIDDTLIDPLVNKIIFQQQNIVLIGMPSCGKSSIASLLAQKLNRKCIDVDEMIANQQQDSISSIFEKKGEQFFRELENKTCKELATTQQLIIASGGGCVLDSKNMEYLAYNGRFVFIQRDLDQLHYEDPSRPLSTDRSAIIKMWQQREPLYLKYADFTVENKQNIEMCVDEIITYLERMMKNDNYN